MADEKNPASEEPQEESVARAEGEEELSDEELDKVAGGSDPNLNKDPWSN